MPKQVRPPRITITGTEGDDSTLVGGNKAEKIIGLKGSDGINGGNGNDQLIGNDDVQLLSGGADIDNRGHNDNIVGGGGTVQPKGNSSDDDLLIGDNRYAQIDAYEDTLGVVTVSAFGSIFGGDDTLDGQRGNDKGQDRH